MKKIKELTLPNFKTCYKAMEIKAMWHWQRANRLMAQLEDPETVYANITHSSSTKMQGRFTEGRTTFPTNTAETTGPPHAKKKK